MTAAELTIYLWAAFVGLLPCLILAALLVNLVLNNYAREKARLEALVRMGVVPGGQPKAKANR